ncbi:hypothetical protein AB0L10_35760 [Streptomyces flaveolus]|uniref:hypothetical protein n=1 Tax=Streptomyces flaveolus TaxID=67297 RepID=UPI00343E26A9
MRVEHRHRLLVPSAQAQLGEVARAFAVAGEVEGQGAAAAGGEVGQERQRPLPAAVARAVQQEGRGPALPSGAHPAEPFAVVLVAESGEFVHAGHSLTPARAPEKQGAPTVTTSLR